MRKLIATLLTISLVSPIWSASSLTYTATGDLVSVASSSSIDNMTAFTILTWVYPDATSEEGRIAQKGTAAPPPWRLEWRPDIATPRMFFARQRATTANIISANFSTFPVYAKNKWLYVAAVTNSAGANGDQHFFMGDGTTMAAEASSYNVQTVGSGTPVTEAGNNLGIGGNPAGGSVTEWNGNMAWIGIWNRALTLSEIHDQQFSPHITSGNVLFMYLGFNDTGTQIDLSGNGNNGTVTGATASSNGPPISIEGAPL